MKKLIMVVLFICSLHNFAFSQNSSPNSVVVLTTGLSNPNAIATDSSYIYWVEYGSGSIKKISNNGGNVITLVSGLYSPKCIVADFSDIYFGEDYGLHSARIKKVSKMGGTVTTLINNLYSIEAFAIDDNNIYYCDFQGNTIQKISKSGGTPVILSTQTNSPSGIVVDENDVYWTEFTNPGNIKKVSKLGGVTILLSNNSNAIGISVDNSNVFWTENISTNLGKINKILKNGGSNSAIATGLNNAWHLCIDDYNVYWTENRTNGAVKQVSKNGGAVITIENNINQPVCITSDIQYVYWIERNSGSNGNLKRANKIITTVNTLSSESPVTFTLQQNFPNPFNPTTKIKFDLPKLSYVRITIYDALGREVEALVEEKLKTGSYETTFNGSKYSSGIYYYKISAGNYSEAKKMLLIK